MYIFLEHIIFYWGLHRLYLCLNNGDAQFQSKYYKTWDFKNSFSWFISLKSTIQITVIIFISIKYTIKLYILSLYILYNATYYLYNLSTYWMHMAYTYSSLYHQRNVYQITFIVETDIPAILYLPFWCDKEL